MPRAVSRSLLAAAVTAILVASGSCTSDPYPLPVPPPHAGQRSPAAIGEAVPAVVLFILPRPGDRIEFMGAEPVGLADGATVEFFFSPPIQEPDGSSLVGEKVEALAGAVALTDPAASADPHGTIGIVARMTASKPGRYTLRAVRLHYRLNGGNEQTGEGIDVIFTICADDPKPGDCTEDA